MARWLWAACWLWTWCSWKRSAPAQMWPIFAMLSKALIDITMSLWAHTICSYVPTSLVCVCVQWLWVLKLTLEIIHQTRRHWCKPFPLYSDATARAEFPTYSRPIQESAYLANQALYHVMLYLYILYIYTYIYVYIYYIYTRIYTYIYIYINHMFNVTVTKLVSGAVYVGRCSTCWVPSCSTPSPMCRRCRRQRWFIRSTRIDMCAMVKTRRIDEDGHRSISRDLEWPIYGFPGMACWYISFDHGTCDGSSCRWLK